jgi:adenylate cyclase
VCQAGFAGLAALGEYEKGLEWARQALEIDPEEPMVLYNVACVQSLAHRYKDALDSIERPVRNGLTDKNWFEHDSNLDPLRSHPRFKRILKQL